MNKRWCLSQRHLRDVSCSAHLLRVKLSSHGHLCYQQDFCTAKQTLNITWMDQSLPVKHSFIFFLLHHRLMMLKKTFLILFKNSNYDLILILFLQNNKFCCVSLAKAIIIHSGTSTNAISLNTEGALLWFLTVYCTLRRYCCYRTKTCSDLASAQVFYVTEQRGRKAQRLHAAKKHRKQNSCH